MYFDVRQQQSTLRWKQLVVCFDLLLPLQTFFRMLHPSYHLAQEYKVHDTSTMNGLQQRFLTCGPRTPGGP